VISSSSTGEERIEVRVLDYIPLTLTLSRKGRGNIYLEQHFCRIRAKSDRIDARKGLELVQPSDYLRWPTKSYRKRAGRQRRMKFSSV
jgi:hypothetical protein